MTVCMFVYNYKTKLYWKIKHQEAKASRLFPPFRSRPEQRVNLFKGKWGNFPSRNVADALLLGRVFKVLSRSEIKSFDNRFWILKAT